VFLLKITVVGAGGIGGLCGGWAFKAGEDVLLVDSWKDHVDAINKNGLLIDGARGHHELKGIKAGLPGDLTEPFELLFIAVKSQHTREAIRGVKHLITPDTIVVSLQNGMNEPVLAEELGGYKQLVSALPDYGGALLGPGVLESTHTGPAYVGELDGTMTDRVKEIHRIVSFTTKTYITDNMWGRLWAKQCYNSQIVTSALVDAPIFIVLGEDRTKRLAGALVRESMIVPEALGISMDIGDMWDPTLYKPTDPESTKRLMANIEKALTNLNKKRYTDEDGYHYVKKGSGIWWDIVYRHRQSEVRWLTGDLVRRGKDLGLDVSCNEKLCDMIYEIEDGKRQLGWHNLDELEAFVASKGKQLPW
jgi:2-dehydropantoate 2-reductase